MGTIRINGQDVQVSGANGSHIYIEDSKEQTCDVLDMALSRWCTPATSATIQEYTNVHAGAVGGSKLC